MASINALSPILALAVGVAHAGLAPVIVIAEVRPNLVLIGTVFVAAFAGLVPGATFAFVAGLVANAFSGEPFGALPLALLVIAAAVAVGALAVRRTAAPIPAMAFVVAATFAGSAIADAVVVLVASLTTGEGREVPVDVVLRAALLNAGLSLLAVAAAGIVRRRRAGRVDVAPGRHVRGAPQ